MLISLATAIASHVTKNISCLAEQVTVLKGHAGLVKGVTWDPVGKYLASQVGVVITLLTCLTEESIGLHIPQFSSVLLDLNC